MEVEHVARIGFASGRTAEEQGDLAICPSMLGEIVVNDKRVATGFHEFFTDGATRIRSDILKRGRFVGRGNHDNGVFHRAIFFKDAKGTSNSSFLLTDRYVDTNHTLAFLINDRIDGDGGLTSLAVTDNQLALTTTNRDH